jgi:glycosyltransferase involved in cell wall biosynthesis
MNQSNDFQNMRVLLVTNTLGKWSEANGVEYTYNNLLPLFSRYNVKCDVLTYGPNDRWERDGSVTTITHKPRLPLPIDPELRVDGLLHWTTLPGAVEIAYYDVVHCATPDPLGFLSARVAERCNAPLVNVYHTMLEYYARVRVRNMMGLPAGKMAEKAMARLLRIFYDKSDLILAPSENTREDIGRMFSPPVEVLGRGIDTETFSPRWRTRNGGKPQAIYVGRVAPEKNLKLLVDIFRGRGDVELKVVGDGPWLNEMRRRLPGAIYTGKLVGEPLWRAFADGDFFAFPSHSDTFGNVVIQGLSSGIPAIVTDSMGPKEQIDHGKTGFVAKNDEEFARYVDTLTGNPELCSQMGSDAREEAEEHTWEKVFCRLMDQYQRAIRHRKTRTLEMAV